MADGAPRRPLPLGPSPSAGVALIGAHTSLGEAVARQLRRRGAEVGAGLDPGQAIGAVETLVCLLGSGCGSAPRLPHLAALAECADRLLHGGELRRVVVVSGTEVYPGGPEPIDEATAPDPVSDEGIALLEAESVIGELARRGGATIVTLRLPHVYGPSSSLLGYVASGVVPFAGALDTVYSHIHVEDAARAVVAALDGPEGTWPLADDSPVSWGEFFAAAAKVRLGLEVIEVDPDAVSRAGTLLSPLPLAVPSRLTPGAGLGWRTDQSIDGRSGWRRLGLRPTFPTIHLGIPAAMTTLLPLRPDTVPAGPTRRAKPRPQYGGRRRPRAAGERRWSLRGSNRRGRYE